MATYKKPDFGQLFSESLKKKTTIIESEVGVETPSLDVASEYQDGENDNASYGDLVELLGALDEEHYNEVADILLDYMDDVYGDEDDFYESDEEDEEDEEDEDLEEDAEFNEAVVAFLAEEGLNEGDMDELSEDELVEIAKRFKGFVKSRKFFSKTASKLRVGRMKNKTANRVKRIKGRTKRKKTRFARKKYQKSRSQAIKIGKHVVKKHRGLKKK